MSEFSNGINIVLAADDNYAQHLGVAFCSIIENYNDSRPLFFHILDNGIDDKNKEYLKVVGRNKNAELIFYNIPECLLAGYPEANRLTKTTYARLLIPKLLPPDIDKVIYLDSDIAVLGNIAELYDQDLGSLSLGAVSDTMAKEILRIYFYPGLSRYFNAGVLLINLVAWRRQNIENRALEFISHYPDDIIRDDQDVLNCLFKDDWKLLDNRFNVDLKRKSFKSMPGSDTVVLHYSDDVKPWHYFFTRSSGCYYFMYLAKTPWNGFKFKDKNLKNFFKKYYLLFIKELKRLLLPYLPNSILDSYRRLLWRTYKMKK